MRTFAGEFLPRLLQELPRTLVYSSLPEQRVAESVWIAAQNPLYGSGVVRRLGAILRHQAAFRRLLGQAGVDLLFCPFHNDGLAFPRSVRQVLIVHDVIPLLFPAEFLISRLLWATLYRSAIRRSAHIICASDATRQSLLQRLRLAPERVSVVHLGYREPAPPRQSVRLPQILYIASAHSAHKNIKMLLRGFARSRICTTHSLRIVGVPHPRETPGIMALIDRLGLRQRVQLLTHLNQEALEEEYRRALFFIYPSLCEGFGLPIIEAMAHGLPVCASRASAMPEVAGDAALFFDPRNASDIAHAMDVLAADPKLRQDLERRGYLNITRFSWTRSAAQCAAICRREGEKR